MNHTAMTLQDLNNENIQKLLAPIVFLFILLLIGVPGNLIVLLIYGKKYRKGVYRSIILNLAVADFIFCTFGIPFNIARVFNYYTFQGRWTCKIFTALLIFGIMYSSHLLMLLSIHRFRQICMPLKGQIAVTNVRYFIIACAIVGVLLTWPQIALIDIDYITPEKNLSAQVCPITHSDPSSYLVAYSVTLLCIFIIYTGILFVIYSVIGRKIYLQKRMKLQGSASENRGNVSGKMTKIAFTISVIFAISYVPLFFLKVAKHWFNEDHLSSFEFSVLRLAERLYILNHVANPFIYAIFDIRFRQNFKLLASFQWNLKAEQRSAQSTSATNIEIN